MSRFALVCVCLAALGGTGALAQRAGPKAVRQKHTWKIAPDLPSALKTMLQAVGTLRYSGVRIIETKSGANRLRHTEIVTVDGLRTRVEFPNGSPLHGQVVIETSKERRQFNPKRNEIQVFPPRREEAYGRIALMVTKRNIQADETNGGDIAGLGTELVTLSDKRGNPQQKLWIDPDSGMIVKREIYDRTGAVAASFEFTSVNLHPIIRGSDFNLPKGATIVTPDLIRRRLLKRKGFQDVTLPPDVPYKLEGARVQKLAQQEVLVQQYAGAGRRVTLYQLKSQIDPQRLGKLERPDLQIYSWQSAGSSFVLVGDLTDAQLRDLGRRLGG